jgi:hypothetical protein
LVEPGIGDDGVVAQEYENVAMASPEALAPSGSETGALGLRQDLDAERRCVPDAREVRGGDVRRAVVDRDQLPRNTGVPDQRADTLAGDFELVEAGNDNRRQAGGGWLWRSR